MVPLKDIPKDDSLLPMLTLLMPLTSALGALLLASSSTTVLVLLLTKASFSPPLPRSTLKQSFLLLLSLLKWSVAYA